MRSRIPLPQVGVVFFGSLFSALFCVVGVVLRRACWADDLSQADLDGSTHLKSVEIELYRSGLRGGEASCIEIADNFGASKPKLRDQFERARQAFSDAEVDRYHGMTLVAGPTGIGKTFIKRDVYEHHVHVVGLPSERVWDLTSVNCLKNIRVKSWRTPSQTCIINNACSIGVSP
ncbi:MAG: hypothetical protein OSA98_21690 [Rubripirellula sp.]|nr:hypothetical protein [Rubripirellula sp.]